jgi:hypothetical protein
MFDRAPGSPELSLGSKRTRAADLRERWGVLGLALLGGAAFVASWFFPWWHYALRAPQYPSGLTLHIALNGVTGDIGEIDILNHYIGMRSMSDAAVVERALSGWIVGGLGLGLPILAVALGRRVHGLLLAVALTLPVVFVVDTNWWMYTFGHDLNPHAPLHVAPFMPNLFGHGKVAQFETWAWAGPGFWLALTAVGLVAASLTLRVRVCAAYPHRDACGATCAHHLVAPPKAP